MPIAPPRPCTTPGCKRLTTSGKCDEHRAQQRQQQDERRGTAHERGYTSRWSKVARRYRHEHPLCAHHLQRGELVPSEVVDHIIPHRGDDRLFWDESNWQALCKQCHDIKTATEDRGTLKNF